MSLERHQLVAEADERLRETGAYVAPQAQIVRALHLGEAVYFTVENPRDVIQSEHLSGRFYELEELAIIARHFPLGGRFLDIGANVGNHSVYVAKFLRASRVAMVEPNPLAIPLLQSNIFLNGLEGVCERRYLGYGLSDGGAETAFIRTGKDNLGGARVKEGEGDVPLRTGDQLFGTQEFDLIKIDVEGMEMKVLAGLAGYLAAYPTRIFIEVDKGNYGAFDEWVAAKGYRVLETFQRYPSNTNFMIEKAS